jgi:hypothetical protein
MSIELDRRPTRFDSQVTKVNINEKDDHAYSSRHGSTEKLPRFSFNQGSIPDNPYNPVSRPVVILFRDSQLSNSKAPRRQSRIPNLKGPSPLPGSQLEFQEQVRFCIFARYFSHPDSLEISLGIVAILTDMARQRREIRGINATNSRRNTTMKCVMRGRRKWTSYSFLCVDSQYFSQLIHLIC